MTGKKNWNYFDRINKQFIKESIPGKKCYVCGTTEDLELHHKIPRCLGGLDFVDNIIFLCTKHHKAVHSNAKVKRPERYYLNKLETLKKQHENKK